MQIERKRRCVSLSLAAVLSVATCVSRAPAQTTQDARSSQPVKTLTLAQAEDYALQNHPRIASSGLRALAAGKIVTEVRSAYFPTLSGNVTGTIADEGTIIAAGTLQTSSLSTRTAAGAGLNQLVTDIGRTADLVHSARLLAAGQKQTAEDARAQVLLAVRQSYYQVLATRSVQNAVQAALENRQLTLRQVNALAQSQMKSTLDVDFEQVLLSEAELAVYQAESSVEESKAQLAAAMGDEHSLGFTLIDEPLPVLMEPNVEEFINLALRDRPDLQALQLSGNAAHQYAAAEKNSAIPL